MEAVKSVVKGFCMERNYPFYSRQADPIRFEVACPYTKKPRRKPGPPAATGGEVDPLVVQDEEVVDEAPAPAAVCSFVISARVHKSKNDQAVIIKRNFNHSCGCMLWAEVSANPVASEWIGTQAGDLLQDVPTARPVHLQNHLRRRLGTAAKYKTVHKAKRKQQRSLLASEIQSFQLVAPFFNKLKERMPGSIAVLERDCDNCLKRTFVMLRPLVEGFQHCLPLLSLDACHLRNTFKGVLMAATMMDAERGTQLLAWGTAPIENSVHWDWFCYHLRKGLSSWHNEDQQARSCAVGRHIYTETPMRRVTFISDREKGILKALKEQFPRCSHQFCIFHIEKNIKKTYGLKEQTKNQILQACKAVQPSVFNKAMDAINDLDPRVYEYLTKIPAENWAASFCGVRKWGVITSNNSEQMNAWMDDVRDGSHTSLHANLVAKVMKRQSDRREMNSNVLGKFPEGTKTLLVETMNAGRQLHVYPGSETKFLVNKTGDTSVCNGREVDLSNLRKPACSCMTYTQTGLPCRHMAAALSYMGGRRAGGNAWAWGNWLMITTRQKPY